MQYVFFIIAMIELICAIALYITGGILSLNAQLAMISCLVFLAHARISRNEKP